MRLLIVDTGSRVGAVGGAERVAANLFYELDKRGIETFYMGYKNDYFKHKTNGKAMFLKQLKQKALKEMGEHIRMNSIMENRIVRIGYYALYSMKGINTTEMEQYVRKVKPDIILANSILDYVILKRLKQSLGNAKIVYMEHANASGSYNSAFDYNIIPLTFGTGTFVGLERARKRFFSFFDGIIALNTEQLRAVKRYEKPATIVHDSYLLDGPKPSIHEINKLKLRLGVKKCRIVLYLGRLSEAQKNISILIKAFRKIKDNSLRLLIVGEGKSKPLYERLSKGDERIMITGRVSEHDLPLFYAISDLYVSPSIWETFNMTLIEAATFGLPLLLSEKAVIEDIRAKFNNELLLFNPNDEEELREKLLLAMDGNKVRHNLLALSKKIAYEYSKKNQMDACASALKKFHAANSF